MNIGKILFGLVIIQLVFITIIVLSATAIRFFDTKGFTELRDYYASYAKYDTDISLVYDGE